MKLFALRLLSKFVAGLPEPVNRALAAFLGECLYRLLPARRRLLLSNLSHAFPDRPHRWLVRAGRASCRRLIETGMLALAFPNFALPRLRRMVGVGPTMRTGLTTLAARPGPIMAGMPHLGAWELFAALPAIWDGPLPTTGGLYRPLNQPVIDKWVKAARERFGFRLLSRAEGLAEGQEILRQGGAFCVLFDQRPRDRGALSLFMDRVCATTNLPELMVEKFRTRLVAIYARRTAFWRYQLEMHLAPALPDRPGAVTRHLDAWLGDLVRSDDEICVTWLWLHDRWKTQLAPERRFRLEHRRSFLAPDEILPRCTRFAVRLPDSAAEVAAALPFLSALRRSRPDGAITGLVAPELAASVEASGACDEIIRLPRPGRAGDRFFRQMRPRYIDCWVVLPESARADREAWLARAPQRFGTVRAGRPRPRLTHVWTAPPELDRSDAPPAAIYAGLFRHFGLREAEGDGTDGGP